MTKRKTDTGNCLPGCAGCCPESIKMMQEIIKYK